MQEFNLDKKFKIFMKGTFVVCLFFFVFAVVFPFLPDDGRGSDKGTKIISILGAVIFGFSTILTWLTLKKLSYADIVVDSDGLWYKHKQKKYDLVPWSLINRVKERSYLQCLDVLDSDGRKLIRVEYQLNNFEKLRSLLNDKISLSVYEKQRVYFSKGVLYHLFYSTGIIGFTWLGLYVGRDNNTLLVYAGTAFLVVSFLYEYFITAYCIEITSNGLTVSYPIRKRIILYSDISSIEMADTFVKGMRRPEVWIITKKVKKPHKLKQLGVDANILYAVLKKQWETTGRSTALFEIPG